MYTDGVADGSANHSSYPYDIGLNDSQMGMLIGLADIEFRTNSSVRISLNFKTDINLSA